MNKVTGWMGAVILTGAVLAGCSAESENPVPEENTENEAVTPVEIEETEQTEKDAAENGAGEASDVADTAEEPAGEASADNTETLSSSAEAVEAAGTFNGIADPHTVEIEVDGEPAAYQVEAGSEAMAEFEQLAEGDSVSFTYVQNGEQLVITEVKASAKETGEAEATGTFNGIADPHTVEIEVNGEPAAYQVEAGSEAMAKFEQMAEGESVTFSYTQNGEQLIIHEVK